MPLSSIRAAIAAASAMVVASCAGGLPSHGGGAGTVDGAAGLNTVSIATLLDDFTKAHLPAPNPRDTTSSTCPQQQCLQAVDTDTVSLLKFPSTGQAEKYSRDTSRAFQAEDLVITFSPSLTSAQTNAYQQVVKSALASGPT